jgi:amidase
LGTDIGGSIRIPAGFNGLYGIRPSHGRLPYNMLANSMEGQETVPSGMYIAHLILISVVGPIAHSIGDIRFFAKQVLEAEPWFQDPKVLELPWREGHIQRLHGRKLTLGILKWDTLVMPHPPVQRAIRIAEEVMKKAGHEIIEWTFPDAQEAQRLLVLSDDLR